MEYDGYMMWSGTVSVAMVVVVLLLLANGVRYRRGNHDAAIMMEYDGRHALATNGCRVGYRGRRWLFAAP